MSSDASNKHSSILHVPSFFFYTGIYCEKTDEIWF